MKKFLSLPAICAIFGAVFTIAGCTNDTGVSGGGKSSVATLTSVRFGDRTATLGAPAAAYAEATAGSVTLLQSNVTVTATPANNKAATEYAKVAAGAVLNEAAFTGNTIFAFATGEHLAVKVTAEDGKTILYYKIGVSLTDIILSTLTVGGNTVSLPNAGTSWQSAAEGSVNFPYAESEQAPGGLAIAATAQPQDAVISYGHAAGDDAPTFSNNANIIFTHGDFLYVRVTAYGRMAYYKVRILFEQIIAQEPVITVQPQGGVKEPYDNVTLSVTAVSQDGGTLSYQWYKAASPADTPVKITGAVSKDYSFSVADTTTFYQAEVKNTLGSTSAVTLSAWAGIIIQTETLPDNWVDKVTIKNTSAPVYGFNLPDGDTFGDYDRIKFTLKFDTASTNLNSLFMRAWGNYNYNSWTDVYYRPEMGNATPNGLLLNVATQANYTAGTWADYTIVLNNRDALNTAAVIKATGGVILLAFAPVPGSGTRTTIFYVKDVSLENADGSKSVKALNPEDPLLFYGYGATAFVTQDNNDYAVTRVLTYE